jgi:hypothetical protein
MSIDVNELFIVCLSDSDLLYLERQASCMVADDALITKDAHASAVQKMLEHMYSVLNYADTHYCETEKPHNCVRTMTETHEKMLNYILTRVDLRLIALLVTETIYYNSYVRGERKDGQLTREQLLSLYMCES